LATNAAFSHLGNQTTLLGVVVLNDNSANQADLHSYGVAIADLDPTQFPALAVSIIVTQATGEQAVVSMIPLKPGSKDSIPADILQGNLTLC